LDHFQQMPAPIMDPVEACKTAKPESQDFVAQPKKRLACYAAVDE